MTLQAVQHNEVMWTPADAKELAATYLEQGSDRWHHVQAVASVACELVAAGAPPELEIAAWLHDIGYSDALARTGMHALDGARFLELLEAPQLVVGLVAFHTGAEFEAEERGLLGKLLEFERPDQAVLDQMILADMVSGPCGERVSVKQRLADILNRYEPEHPVHRAVSLSGDYLTLASERASAVAAYPM